MPGACIYSDLVQRQGLAPGWGILRQNAASGFSVLLAQGIVAESPEWGGLAAVNEAELTEEDTATLYSCLATA
jgi:hypothetical protein